MTKDDALRDAVAAQLVGLTAPGKPLHADSPRRTTFVYKGDPARAIVQKALIDRYLAHGKPPATKRSAVITAGPPGAGKTSSLNSKVTDLASYRILDADIMKEYLIQQALADGIYNDLLQYQLADGHPLAPAELATLVHDESVELIERVRDICVARGENVVIEATLRWPDHGPEIFARLAAADYATVRILAVEADRDFVHDQALTRWWLRRKEWTQGKHPLGGRLVPPAAIDMCYRNAKRSHCAEHAIRLIERAEEQGEIETVRLTLVRRTSTTTIEDLFDREVKS